MASHFRFCRPQCFQASHPVFPLLFLGSLMMVVRLILEKVLVLEPQKLIHCPIHQCWLRIKIILLQHCANRPISAPPQVQRPKYGVIFVPQNGQSTGRECTGRPTGSKNDGVRFDLSLPWWYVSARMAINMLRSTVTLPRV